MAEQQMQYDDGSWSRIVEVDEPYTPTTEEVRDDYAHHQTPPGIFDVRHEFAAGREAFERWLAEHDARVRTEERERCAQIADGNAIDPDTEPHLSTAFLAGYRDAGLDIAAAIREGKTDG